MTGFDYKNHEIPKLTEEFKQKFTVDIKGKKAIKVDGLIAFAHTKGIKSMVVEVTQYPNQENNYTCIAKCRVVGYDWSPAENKIIEVAYEDFADANPNNCTKLTASSYPRMASTRAVGRALRKYTNIDMVTSEEISDAVAEPPKPRVTRDQLDSIKNIIRSKKIPQAACMSIMKNSFNLVNFTDLTPDQAEELMRLYSAYIPEPQNAPA